MGNSYRVRIGLKEIAGDGAEHHLLGPGGEGLRGSEAVFRRHHLQRRLPHAGRDPQRWQKLERFPIFTPHIARQEAIRVLRAKALGQDPAGEKMALLERNDLIM